MNVKTVDPAEHTGEDERIAMLIRQFTGGFRDQIRSPILATPADVGLQYDNVTFPSEDGVPLEAWYIPRAGSDRIIIANHPRWANRYGLPAHLEPWKSIGARTGNDFEVNFMADYRILHEAGYNILTYDIRNHGHSGAGNGNLVTTGIYESRDVVGSLDYVSSHPDLKAMTVGLFGKCLGSNATLIAMARRPDRFRNVRCFVGAQPISVRAFVSRIFALNGFPTSRLEDLDQSLRLVTSFGMDALSPLEHAKSVQTPTFLYQVRDDLMADSNIVQQVYDNIPILNKHLFWIENTTRRFDGYTYFSRQPEQMLDWFERNMGSAN